MSKCPAASAVVRDAEARPLDRQHPRQVLDRRAGRRGMRHPRQPVVRRQRHVTILPPRASGIIAFVATAWVISHVPSTFRRTTVRKPLGVMSSAGRHVLAAGVVHEHVDLPVTLEDGVDERVDLLLLADVAHPWRRSARPRTCAAVSSQRLIAAPAHDHPRAAGRQLDRGGAAQAASPRLTRAPPCL